MSTPGFSAAIIPWAGQRRQVGDARRVERFAGGMLAAVCVQVNAARQQLFQRNRPDDADVLAVAHAEAGLAIFQELSR